MIALDTSALIAIALDEPQAEACIAALERESDVLMSAGTLAEALVVSTRRDVWTEVVAMVEGLDVDVFAVTTATARSVGEAYQRWGKGKHPAALNFGDCFAYVLAKEHNCPLLYVGNDFARTDIEGVL